MSPSVIKLWISGDPMMQHKISTGVTNIKLVDRRWVTSGRFPKFITELRSLRYLTIDRDGFPVPYFRDILEHIRCLPPTLKKLKIRVKDSLFCIFPLWPIDALDPSPSALTYVPNDSIQPAWMFAAAFPQLETLELDFNQQNFWDRDDFALLPPSLTSITLITGPFEEIPGCYDIEEEFASSLPRQLQILRVRLRPSVSPSAWSQLPPNLTKLDMNLDLTSTWNIKHLTSLTHLRPGECQGRLEFADLPHGLTYLDTAWLCGFHANAHLLKNFTNLKKLMFDDPPTAEILRFVPPSIQFIRHDAAHEGLASLWPPSLTQLHAGCIGNRYPTSYFPLKGLVSLKLHHTIDAATLASFPHTLRTLDLRSITMPDNQQDFAFPPQLTNFTWAFWNFQFEAIDESTGELCSHVPSINGKKVLICFSFLTLPRSLLYLRLHAIIPASQLKHLPPLLKQLQVRDIFADVDFVDDDATEMSAMHAVFKIGAAEGIESDRFDWTQLKRASIATLLPRTLVDLKFDGDAFNASKPEWSMMPPHLTHLHCNPAAGIPAHFLGEIPMKRMKVLRLVVDGAEEQHLKLVPRNLYYAEIRLINSPDLPITALKYLQAEFFSFPDRHHLQQLTFKLMELQRSHIEADNPSLYLRLLHPDDDLIKQLGISPR